MFHILPSLWERIFKSTCQIWNFPVVVPNTIYESFTITTNSLVNSFLCGRLLVNDQCDAQILFYVFISIYIEKNLCITLVIYQESLHDARSTKCKNYVAEFRVETSCHINKTIYKGVGCDCEHLYILYTDKPNAQTNATVQFHDCSSSKYQPISTQNGKWDIRWVRKKGS